MKTSKSLLVILLFSIFIQSCSPLKSKVGNQKLRKNIIPVSNAIKMHAEYKKNRSDLLEDTLKNIYNVQKFEDTQFVWFTLEEMENYINYIKAIKNENPKQEVSGVRIYFAAYPDSNELNNREIKYPRQQTVFMVPTVKSYNSSERFNTMNHLPFAIKPQSPNNPIKGSFVILEGLMLKHNLGSRTKLYYERNSNSVSTNSSSSSNRNFASTSSRESASGVSLTSTILNEGELAPPPEKED